MKFRAEKLNVIHLIKYIEHYQMNNPQTSPVNNLSTPCKYRPPNEAPEHPRMKEFLSKQPEEVQQVFKIAKESLQSSFIPQFTTSFQKYIASNPNPQ
jgi:hypothetical protein